MIKDMLAKKSMQLKWLVYILSMVYICHMTKIWTPSRSSSVYL